MYRQEHNYDVGDQIYFYNENKGLIEKKVIRQVIKEGRKNDLSISYTIEGLKPFEITPSTISETKLLLVSSKNRGQLADYVTIQLDKKIKAADKLIEACREDLKKARAIKRDTERKINEIQLVKVKRGNNGKKRNL